jgi:hypothetical protein
LAAKQNLRIMIENKVIPDYFKEIEVCISYTAYKKSYANPSTHKSLYDVFVRMYEDSKLKTRTETVIESVGTAQYSKFKNLLPAFVLGDHFQQGSYNSNDVSCQYPFKSLSKYFAIDLDGFNCDGDMLMVLDRIKQIDYVCCAFPSPSRLGFRVIVQTDFETETFERYTNENDNDVKFDIVENKFKPATEYILNEFAKDASVLVKSEILAICKKENVTGKDIKGYIKTKGLYHIDVLKDVSRMWFFSSILSKDRPFIYINNKPIALSIDYDKYKTNDSQKKNYKKFNGTFKSNSELDRFNAEFDLLGFLEEEGFGRVGNSGNAVNLLSPNSSSKKSGDFIEQGFHGNPVFVNYSTSCEFAKYKQVNTIFNAYECVKFLKFDGDKDKTFDYLRIIGYNIHAAKTAQIKDVTEIYNLIIDKYGNAKGVKFDSMAFIKFLNINGFKKVLNDSDFDLIKTEGLICEKVTVTFISDFVKDELLKSLKDDVDEAKLVLNAYVDNYKKLYSTGSLDLLQSINISTFNDTLAVSYIMYQNGLLEIRKDDVSFSVQKDKYIWTENTLKRNFDLERFNSSFKGLDFDIGKGDFEKLEKFKYLIENSEFANFSTLIMNDDMERFKQLCSSFGYLINTYRDPTNPRAVIFCDESINLNDKPEGGSGKGLLLKAVSKMRLSTPINGKNFDPNNQFCFAGFIENSNVLVIEDIEKYFDFESLFFYMTEGLVIRRLHENPILLAGDNYPKVALTTNYTVLGDSSSHRRRKVEIELFNYFSDELTPLMQYGRRFWGDKWNDEDWFYFDSFMLLCVQYFLKNNLYFVETLNLQLRKLYQATNVDFIEFIQEQLKGGIDKHIKDLYNSFKESNSDFDNHKFKVRTFTKWLTTYIEYQEKQEDNEFNFEIKRDSIGKRLEVEYK